MAKKSTKIEKDLRAQVKQLRAAVDRAEARADRWKTEARQAVKATKKSEQRIAKLTKRLDRAPGSPAAPGRPAQDVTGPDESWTVVALKDEARARGLTGFSRLSKSELLATLR